MAGSIACSEADANMTESLSLDAAETWITTVNGRLYAKRWGGTADGAVLPPIVLLHDSLGCVELWRDFPQRLAQATGRAVIAYDRLGFGQSDPHRGPIGADFIRQEAHTGFSALIDQLGVERFIAFGHSVGGGMAVSIAAAYPDRCVGLITESAQAFVEAQTREGIRTAQAQFAEPGQMSRLERYHGDKAHWVLDAWVSTWLSPAFADWCLDEELLGVRCPVLAMHGTEDEYGSTAQPERIVTLAGAPARLALLQRCGHVPHREQEATVLDAVRAFVTASH
ncbi:2-succinyl-6-hydroxy-2, 4-cyclohexadiene-1-carboxylate synthase [Ralstonia flaminis]|jgi:pimeloyl-ACP methyl ester carboxylesterase|uniref:2-succinyl-6-hydroxy-2, 4-cyclohexadiene-1-carboxylate synthase n=2 Tax=Ralstonia flaminis TaxID=3058597 RepID=A0ABN9JVE8_9RALS|nr:2-succinyl-6-hydroxy-2, 4-cyclohexadiene-1-carboxylate synthase [Ralstonia sp. LMG 18101]